MASRKIANFSKKFSELSRLQIFPHAGKKRENHFTKIIFVEPDTNFYFEVVNFGDEDLLKKKNGCNRRGIYFGISANEISFRFPSRLSLED